MEILNKYTARIELHGAQQRDYDTLHELMAGRGFYRTIIDEATGIMYHLPTATYSTISALAVDDITSVAYDTARLTGLQCEVIITKSAGTRWLGLEPVYKTEQVLLG